MASRWSHFEHEANIGIRGEAPSKQEAFEGAALALTAVITDPANVKTQEEIAISCAAPDDELLPVDWLNALIYEMATLRMIFGRFRVRIDNGRLEGTA